MEIHHDSPLAVPRSTSLELRCNSSSRRARSDRDIDALAAPVPAIQALMSWRDLNVKNTIGKWRFNQTTGGLVENHHF